MPDIIVKFGFFKMFSYETEEELDSQKADLVGKLQAFGVDAVVEEEEDQELYGLELDESSLDADDEESDSDDDSTDESEDKN